MGEKPGETEDNPVAQATAPMGPPLRGPSGPPSDAPIGPRGSGADESIQPA